MIGPKRGLLWKRHLLIDTKQKTNELCQFIDIDGDGKREWVANQWNKKAPMIIWHQDEKGKFNGQKSVLKVVNGSVL